MKAVHALLLTATLVAAGAPALAAPARVTAADAWCRPTAKGAPTGGCYVTLTASGDDRVLGVETPAGQRAEVHTMSMAGGIMRMRKLADGLALPAGRPVMLKPGGEHVMIFGLKQALAPGAAVPLTFRFANSAPLTVQAQVRATAGMAH